jgi:hypothetical protein
LLWRAVIETKDRWIAVRIHHLSRQPSDAWRRQSIAKSDSPWIEKARDLPAVRTYAWFAGNRLRAQHAVADGHHVVEFHDMRYCFPTEGLESFWPLTVIFSDTGEVLHVGRQHATPHSSTLRAAWSDLWNP